MNYIDIFQNHFKEVFPETFLVIATTIILLYAVSATGPKVKLSTGHSYVPIWAVTHAGKLAVLALSLTAALSVWQLRSTSATIFNGTLIIDDLTIMVRTLILVSALASILISFSFIEGQRINSWEYILLILFSTLSMLLIVSSYDLISMYLAIELQTLCFYVLAAFRRNNEFSTEAGLKYFVLGALSSGLLLFGESIIYGSTGITNFEELAKFFTFGSYGHTGGFQIMSLGVLLMLIAFLFKIGAVPFHMWTPDIYEGAPTCVTAFFAITPKVAILSLMVRLCLSTFWDAIASWEQIIIVCSLLSMLIGVFGALNQNRAKRLFAYSSIAHVGYLLIALATGTIEAAESLLSYIIIHMLMVIGAFGALLILSRSALRPRTQTPAHIWRGNISSSPHPIATSSHAKPEDERTKYITDFGFISKTNPILAATVATILFSNAGIPPSAGFYGKSNISPSAVSGSMYFLAVAGVLCATMGAFHSIRSVKIIYYHPSKPHWESPKQISKESAIILASTFSLTSFFFLHPSSLFTITHPAASTLSL